MSPLKPGVFIQNQSGTLAKKYHGTVTVEMEANTLLKVRRTPMVSSSSCPVGYYAAAELDLNHRQTNVHQFEIKQAGLPSPPPYSKEASNYCNRHRSAEQSVIIITGLALSYPLFINQLVLCIPFLSVFPFFLREMYFGVKSVFDWDDVIFMKKNHIGIIHQIKLKYF